MATVKDEGEQVSLRIRPGEQHAFSAATALRPHG